MKLDMHVHCQPISACASITPEELVAHYKNHGFDGLVLTNHVNFWNVEGHSGLPSDFDEQRKMYIETYERAKTAGEKIGFTVIFGVELRLNQPENGFEYLLYGVDYDAFAEMYPGIYWTQEQLWEFCQKHDIFVSQAHPMRYNDGKDAPNRRLLNAMEVYNPGPDDTSEVPLTGERAKKLAEESGLAFTAGSDLHHLRNRPQCGIITETDVHNQFELRDVLKSRKYKVFYE